MTRFGFIIIPLVFLAVLFCLKRRARYSLLFFVSHYSLTYFFLYRGLIVNEIFGISRPMSNIIFIWAKHIFSFPMFFIYELWVKITSVDSFFIGLILGPFINSLLWASLLFAILKPNHALNPTRARVAS